MPGSTVRAQATCDGGSDLNVGSNLNIGSCRRVQDGAQPSLALIDQQAGSWVSQCSYPRLPEVANQLSLRSAAAVSAQHARCGRCDDVAGRLPLGAWAGAAAALRRSILLRSLLHALGCRYRQPRGTARDSCEGGPAKHAANGPDAADRRCSTLGHRSGERCALRAGLGRPEEDAAPALRAHPAHLPCGITPPCAGAPVVSEAAEPARVACGACTAATPAPACCCRRRESCHESCRRCE